MGTRNRLPARPNNPLPVAKFVLALLALQLSSPSFVSSLESQPGSAGVALWSFDEASAIGPAFWPTLPRESDGFPAFPACASSVRPQSPIAITSAPVDASLGPLDFSVYANPGAQAQVTNDGRVPRLVPAGTVAKLGFAGRLWSLQVAEMRVPGEHTFGGSASDMELHLVHRAAAADGGGTTDEDWLVLVVPWRATTLASHRELRKVLQDVAPPPRPFEAVPSTTNSTLAASNRGVLATPITTEGPIVDVSWAGFLPVERSYFTYTGTWSYPPCTAAAVVVMEAVQALSSAQLELIANMTRGSPYAPITNARPAPAQPNAVPVRRYIDAPLVAAAEARQRDEAPSVAQRNLGVAIAALVMSVLCALGFVAMAALGPTPVTNVEPVQAGTHANEGSQ